MKKVWIGIVSFIVILIGAIVAIPLFVDVDQYRPKIVEVANEKLNGKLALGKLSLSVWGTIKVNVDGLELTDAKTRQVVSVKNAHFQIPWTSIFGGAPLLTFVMEQPDLLVVKDAQGKMNVLTLMKEQPAGASAAGAPGASNDQKGELPGFVSKARLGIDIQNSKFVYRDEMTKTDAQLDQLNIVVRDLSLSRETEMEISGQLKSAADKAFRVEGPFKISARAKPEMAGSEWKKATISAKGDFTDLELQAGTAFFKKKGMSATLDASIEMTPDSVIVQNADVKFFNLEVKTSGRVTELKNEATGPVTQLSLKSNRVDLKPWNELIPALKEFQLSGEAGFAAEVFGPTSKIQYRADLDVKDLKMKSEYLKQEPTFNLGLKVSTDQIDRFFASLTAPSNDLKIEGSLVSFQAPRGEMKVTSNGLDFDQLLKLPPLEKKTETAASAPAQAGGGEGGKAATGAKTKSEDLDAMLDPLRANAIAKNTVFNLKADLKQLKVYDIKMSDIALRAGLKDLIATIDSFQMKLWDGSLQTKATMNMKPKAPTYSFNMGVAGLDIQKAMSSQMEIFKNTVVGKLTFKMDGNGASFNPAPAKVNLNAKGTMRVENADFQSIDIGKMAVDAVNKSIDKVAEKIPALKDKTLKPLSGRGSKYEAITSDFTLTQGRFNAPNFVAKAALNQGIDLKGSTQVGLVDQELKAEWELIDTYNLTKAKDVSIELAGKKVEGLLAEKGQPVTMPVSVGCKYTSPCASYGKVPEHFIKVAAGNMKGGAIEVVKEKGKEKLQEAGKKLLKGLFK